MNANRSSVRLALLRPLTTRRAPERQQGEVEATTGPVWAIERGNRIVGTHLGARVRLSLALSRKGSNIACTIARRENR
jgi:hypothetical protein